MYPMLRLGATVDGAPLVGGTAIAEAREAGRLACEVKINAGLVPHRCIARDATGALAIVSPREAKKRGLVEVARFPPKPPPPRAVDDMWPELRKCEKHGVQRRRCYLCWKELAP